MQELTARQTDVYNFLTEYFDEQGYYPTRAEIAIGMKFKSPNAADTHLKALAKKGAIKLIPAIARGIQLPRSPGSPGILIFSIKKWVPEKKLAN